MLIKIKILMLKFIIGSWEKKALTKTYKFTLKAENYFEPWMRHNESVFGSPWSYGFEYYEN